MRVAYASNAVMAARITTDKSSTDFSNCSWLIRYIIDIRPSNAKATAKKSLRFPISCMVI